MGAEKLVLFGTCGVLDEDIKETSIIIPSHALRDEGTSFHYVEASDEIAVNVGVLDRFRSYLNERRFLIRKARSGQLMVFTVRRVLNSFERQQEPFVCGYGMLCSCSFAAL